MIDKIKKLNDNEARNILVDIMSVYFDKGFGLMNKTEIETLFYHVLKEHRLLEGKCYQDSFVLKIPEAKARKLLYESQVKYGTNDTNEMLQYLRKTVGNYLSNAYFSKNNNEIRFAIEDKYTRIALLAKLRDNNFFADTSFNKDIISLDEEALTKLVLLLVPNTLKDDVLEKINKLTQTKKNTISEVTSFMKDSIKDSFKKVSAEGIIKVGTILMACAS